MIIGSGPKIEAKKYGMVYLGIQNIAPEKSWKIGHNNYNSQSELDSWDNTWTL